MNKPRLMLSILLLAAGGPVLASDFRALDFDASCADVASKEAALGSTPYTEQLPSGFQYAFNNREKGRDVIVGYACKDGHFFRGAYIYMVKDGADATKLYTELKRQVTKERGKPSYDFAGAEYRNKMKAIGAKLDPVDTQVAFWNNGHSEAHASVAAPSGTRGWRVSLSYTAEGAADK
jgi:glucan biosynthesis protein